MSKRIFATLLFFMSLSISAVELDYAVGFGFPTSGIGGQVIVKSDNSQYHLGLGSFGGNIGVRTTVGDSGYHSVGANIGRLSLLVEVDYVDLTYTYHINGFHNEGWEVGADLILLGDGVIPALHLSYKF